MQTVKTLWQLLMRIGSRHDTFSCCKKAGLVGGGSSMAMSNYDISIGLVHSTHSTRRVLDFGRLVSRMLRACFPLPPRFRLRVLVFRMGSACLRICLLNVACPPDSYCVEEDTKCHVVLRTSGLWDMFRKHRAFRSCWLTCRCCAVTRPSEL